MALLMVSKGKYKNSAAIANGILYITRTRKNENRRNELVSYGARGASDNPLEAIQQFKVVQQNFKESNYIGSRIFHETLLLDELDLTLLNYDHKHIHNYAECCAFYYYLRGFQVVFAVHWDQEKKYHIHFVGNAVSYMNGLKWEASYTPTREQHHINCLMWYHRTFIVPQQNIVQPISFDYSLRKTNSCLPEKKKKYYVVAKGRNCGIYEDYTDALNQIERYSNAVWKACTSLEEAYYYLEQNLEYRNYYVISIWGFSKSFAEYHSFMNFLNIFKDKYPLKLSEDV